MPKAAFVLDLYAGEWDGHALRRDELITSADEKTSIQARIRCHRSIAATARHPMFIGHEYEPGVALQPPAAWGVEMLAANVLAFQVHREVLTRPFEWKLTRGRPRQASRTPDDTRLRPGPKVA